MEKVNTAIERAYKGALMAMTMASYYYYLAVTERLKVKIFSTFHGKYPNKKSCHKKYQHGMATNMT